MLVTVHLSPDAESSFDPYLDGAAVTGTTTVGMISWESGVVETDLTVDVTGHELEFIDLTCRLHCLCRRGRLSRAAGLLNWAAPTQPWGAADALLLRVRRIAW